MLIALCFHCRTWLVHTSWTWTCVALAKQVSNRCFNSDIKMKSLNLAKGKISRQGLVKWLSEKRQWRSQLFVFHYQMENTELYDLTSLHYFHIWRRFRRQLWGRVFSNEWLNASEWSYGSWENNNKLRFLTSSLPFFKHFQMST